MPLDPSINAKIDELVADLRAKEQSFSDASDANDAAQTAAQAAVATASGTSQAKGTAHDALSASIDDLVAYVTSLKTT
jgi:hypothetical protein